MSLSEALVGELQYEAATTRKCLERIPETNFDWKPHEKSMTMGRLATHLAEMVGWVKDTVETPELDFATMDYKPFEPKTTAELIEFFDKNISAANESLKNVSDESMLENWKMRNGEQIYFDMPRIAVLRGFILKHIVHHRGQLSVYLRLNDIPVPEIYGPSADEGTM
ncbi:MAG: DinB family protein [Acidobacteriota bacterium]|nr:DinB family protein [Acidobacteriota bacterium]